MACCNDNSFSKLAKNKVQLQEQINAIDAYGGSVVTWSTVATFWAVVETITGKEAFLNEQLQSSLTHKITIRYNSTYSNTKDIARYKILLDGREHNVRYVMSVDSLNAGSGRSGKNLYGKNFLILYTEENIAELQNG